MNKKAQESLDFLMFVPRFIFLIVVAFSIIFVIRHYVVQNLNVQGVQAEVLENRILYSPNGILYFDENLNREVPGEIDLKKVTNERLDQLINYTDKELISAEVKIQDISGKQIVSAKYNMQTHDRWATIEGLAVQGAGGVKKFTKLQFIQYYSENKLNPGFINFTVFLPGN
jgi:hypothetical protein